MDCYGDFKVNLIYYIISIITKFECKLSETSL